MANGRRESRPGKPHRRRPPEAKQTTESSDAEIHIPDLKATVQTAGQAEQAEAPLRPDQMLMALTEGIYLDTQPFFESNWPTGSSRLREFCTLARGRGIPVFVPDPVLQELEQQFREKVVEANEAITRAAKSVRSTGSPAWEVKLLDVEVELPRYRERVDQALKTLFIKPVSITEASAADMFATAVARGRPFHTAGNAKDAGFKDAVILRSICDDVEDRGFSRVVVVTADGHHEETDTFHRAVTTFETRTLGQALDALRSAAATVEQVEGWQQRLALATTAASTELDHVGGFVAEQVQASYTALPNTKGTVTGVRSAKAITAAAVDIFPGLGDVAVGEDVDLTLYVGVELDVTVEQPKMPDLPADASPLQRIGAMLAAPNEVANLTVPAFAEVEVRAERTQTGYANLRPTAARLRVGDKAADEEAERRRHERWFGKEAE